MGAFVAYSSTKKKKIFKVYGRPKLNPNFAKPLNFLKFNRASLSTPMSSSLGALAQPTRCLNVPVSSIVHERVPLFLSSLSHCNLFVPASYSLIVLYWLFLLFSSIFWLCVIYWTTVG